MSRYFWSIFTPPPPSFTLCHTSQDPPKKYFTHLAPPRIFSRPSTKNPDKISLHKFSLNCSRGFCPGGFIRGSLVWKVLSGVVFVHSSFCHNTSVTSYNRKLNITLNFMFNMYDKKIV